MKVIFGDAKILPVDDILHTTLNAVEALKYPVKMPLSIDLNANARERPDLSLALLREQAKGQGV